MLFIFLTSFTLYGLLVQYILERLILPKISVFRRVAKSEHLKLSKGRDDYCEICNITSSAVDVG